jgi:hypothetical protein
MPLDRISSATPYAALALVQAATANAPRLESPRAAPAGASVTMDVKALALRVNGGAANGRAAVPESLQAREDRLGQRLDARA